MVEDNKVIVFNAAVHIIEELADEIGFVTETMSESAYEEKAAKLSSVLQMIRFI